jgi:PAS domain-containing protein
LSAPEGASARALVERHPAPALLVAADGTVLAASAPAEALLAGGDRGWLDELYAWLCDDGADGATPRLAAIPGQAARTLVEWVATPLADNTVALLGRDVTLDHGLREALVDSRRRLRDLLDLAADFAWETGGDGRFTYLSPAGILGPGADGLIGAAPDALLAEPGLARSPFEARRRVDGERVRIRLADGQATEVAIWARPLFDAAGAWAGARGLARRLAEGAS